ncbi:MAG: NAD(P)H-dependent oxidoreductase [Clostridiales bacterium]|nr:NAD(P)H-dependent oxidoreductase [Clostridiales bacterium]
MQYLIVTGSSEQDGVCHGFLQEILRGAADGGAQAGVLDPEGIGRCKACNEGSGACRTDHRCAFGKDGFDEAQEMVKASDSLCVITPLSWGEMAEPVKNFLERLRRCENGLSGALAGKPVLVVVHPDEAGSGALAGLEQIDKFCRQTGAVIFDFLCVNRWNNDYQRVTAYSAARSMAYGRKAGGLG